MFASEQYQALRQQIAETVVSQRQVLEQLRADVRPLKNEVRRIKPRSTTSISIVGTDGGNNQIAFDPFLVQLVRVVDSSMHDYCLEVVPYVTDRDRLHRRHLSVDGTGITPLGRMMALLGVSTLDELSVMIPAPPAELKPSWITVYRELQEWAVLLDLVRSQAFVADTLIMRDGWLRTKAFATGLFPRYLKLLQDALVAAYERTRRRVYIAGVLKSSKVIQKYHLALALEGILRNAYPSYLPIPTSLQEKVFKWGEIVGARTEGKQLQDAINMVGGEMFLVKFGSRTHDPIWAVDILSSQVDQAATIFGYMLADADAGFPAPFFPRSLQKAHEHAAIEGLDLDVLQDRVSDAIRNLLAVDGPLIDEFEINARADDA